MRPVWMFWACVAGLVALPGQAGAATFDVSFDFGPQVGSNLGALGDGFLTGTLVTDGRQGALSAQNILEWTFDFGIVGSYTRTISHTGAGSLFGNPEVFSDGSALFVDGTDLVIRQAVGSDFIQFLNGTELVQISRAVNSAGNAFLSFRAEFVAFGVPGSVGQVVGQDTVIGSVPVPAALPLALTGLGVLGLLGRRRRSPQAIV